MDTFGPHTVQEEAPPFLWLGNASLPAPTMWFVTASAYMRTPAARQAATVARRAAEEPPRPWREATEEGEGRREWGEEKKGEEKRGEEGRGTRGWGVEKRGEEGGE